MRRGRSPLEPFQERMRILDCGLWGRDLGAGVGGSVGGSVGAVHRAVHAGVA